MTTSSLPTPRLTGPVLTLDPQRMRAWLDAVPDPEARPGRTRRDILGYDSGAHVYDLLDNHHITRLIAWAADDADHGGHDGLADPGWETKPGVTLTVVPTYGRRDNRADGADGLFFTAQMPLGDTVIGHLRGGLSDTTARGEAALEHVLTRLTDLINLTAVVNS